MEVLDVLIAVVVIAGQAPAILVCANYCKREEIKRSLISKPCTPF